MISKFRPAAVGLLEALRDRSIRIQFVLAAMAFTAAIVLRLEFLEWIIVIMAAGAVIAAEMFNTCIERLCDVVMPERDERIRYIKDLAAGTVLLVSLTALLIALMILIRHLKGLIL